MAQPFEETDRAHGVARLIEELRAGYRQIAGHDAPSEEEVGEALRTLGAACSSLAKVVEVAGRDEAVRRHLGNAAASLGEAVTTFLAEISSPTDSTDQTEGAAS